MNRAKNKYLVECNMFDDFFDWYKKRFPYVEDSQFPEMAALDPKLPPEEE